MKTQDRSIILAMCEDNKIGIFVNRKLEASVTLGNVEKTNQLRVTRLLQRCQVTLNELDRSFGYSESVANNPAAQDAVETACWLYQEIILA